MMPDPDPATTAAADWLGNDLMAVDAFLAAELGHPVTPDLLDAVARLVSAVRAEAREAERQGIGPLIEKWERESASWPGGVGADVRKEHAAALRELMGDDGAVQLNASAEQMLRAFHAAGGFILPAAPTLDISADRFTSDEKRQDMLDKEVQELRDAVADRDLVGIADALADIVYVCVGTAVTYGLPFDQIFAEVHRSNMTKFIGGPVIDSDGKIVKGPRYEPPRIADLLDGDGGA